MRKRVFSLCMAFAMCLSLMPGYVWAVADHTLDMPEQTTEKQEALSADVEAVPKVGTNVIRSEGNILLYGGQEYRIEDGQIYCNEAALNVKEGTPYKIALADNTVYAIVGEQEEWIVLDDSLAGEVSLLGNSDNEKEIFLFVQAVLGVNTAATCGILANIYAESSFNPSTYVIDTNGLPSYGICQWNGGRYTALQDYCSRNGYDYTTISGQLEYLKHELTGSESSAFNKIISVPDTAQGAYDAGYNWARYFERCDARYHTGRAERARDVYWSEYSALQAMLLSNDAQILVNYLNNKVGAGYKSGYCQMFVWDSIHDCFGRSNTKQACCATKAWQSYRVSSSRDNIPLGAAVYFGGSKTTDSVCGQEAGHVALYVGDGYIVHDWGPKIVKTTIDYVLGYGYSYRGWGWQADYPLDGNHVHEPIQRNSKSGCVLELQKMLNKVINAGLGEDGDFGERTEIALKRYQTLKDLTVDGICGENTWPKLEADYNNGVIVNIEKPALNVSVNNNFATFSWGNVNHAISYDLEVYYGNLGDYSRPIEPGKQWSVSSGHVLELSANSYWAQVAAVDAFGGFNFSDGIAFDVTASVARGSEMAKGFDRTLPDGDYIIASALNPSFYLDISGSAVPAADKDNVILWELVGDIAPHDVWTLKYTDGFYRISQMGAPSSLDVFGLSVEDKGNVSVYSNNESSAQKWLIRESGSRDGYAVAAKCSGYWLTVENKVAECDANVCQRVGDSSSAQSWLFIPYKPEQPIKDGKYVLISAMSDNIEMDVSGDSGDIPDGTNVQTWQDTAPSQYNSFEVKALGNGYYNLIHAASGKALEVNKGTSKLNENIQVSAKKTDAAYQQWAITKNRDGYVLRNRGSGLTLDVENGNQNREAGNIKGINIRQWIHNASTAQTWKFVQAEYTVSYNANNGTGAPGQQIKYYKSALKLSDSRPTRSGYTFKGWSTSSNSNNVQYQPGENYTRDSNVTLYAVWNKIPDNLTWGDVNGDGKVTNDDALLIGDYSVGNVTFTSEQERVADVNGDGTIDVDDALLVADYVAGEIDEFPVEKKTITFNPTGGTVSRTTQEVRNGKTYGDLPTPSRSGYTFDGWFTAENGGTQITSGTTVNLTSDQILYAHWTVVPPEESSDIYAILYDDGTLVFQNGDTPKAGRTVARTYSLDLTAQYTLYDAPWYGVRDFIQTVDFADKVSPVSTACWFYDCHNLTSIDNIQNLDTSNVTDMYCMFDNCCRLTTLDLSYFNTANVTNMGSVFIGCTALTALDLSHFDTTNVTGMGYMFSGCSGLTALDVSCFNTANVKYMGAMFSGCRNLKTLDVSSFDTTNVVDMYAMFNECSSLTTLDLSGFNTANVTTMRAMFADCNGLTALDLSGFNTANVTDMRYMFYQSNGLKIIYVSEKFQTELVSSSNDMFSDCTALVGGNGTTYDSGHIDKAYARIDAPSMPGYFTDKNRPTRFLTSIEIISAPTKTVYNIGDSLSTTGLTIRANYSDGSSENISNSFTVSSLDSSSVGSKPIMVTYGGKTVSFTVDVQASEHPTRPDAPQILVENKRASKGSAIDVPVVIKNNPGISGATLAVSYDKSVLTLASVTKGTVFENGNYTVYPETGVVQWYHTENVIGNGVLFTLQFTVNGNAQNGSYNIAVGLRDGIPANLSNADSNVVNAQFISGVLEIASGIRGDVTEDGVVAINDVVKLARAVAGNLTLTEVETAMADVTGDGVIAINDVVKLARYVAGNLAALQSAEAVSLSGGESAVIEVATVSGKPGETVRVPVSVISNPGIAGAQLDVLFDSGLTLKNIVQGDVLSAGTFNPDISNGRIQWYYDQANVTNTGVLFTLEFEISSNAKNGDAYAVTVNVKDGITANFSDYDFNPVNAEFKPGKVQIGDTSGNAVINTVSRNGNTVTANVVCSDSNASVFCGVYNNSGKMIAVRSVQVTSESTYKFQFDGQQFDYAKVFVLDSNFCPLCVGKKS